VTGLTKGEMGHGADRCGKGRRDGERKAGRPREIGPKEQTEYRNNPLISRIYGLNKIRSNSNEFDSKLNSRIK
jgi:hypothetical protein